jgi:hypothetical protein
MSQLPYRFEIDKSVPLTEAEMTLQLAMLALEGLYGQAQVRLEARYHLDEGGRALVVEGGNEVGTDLVRVFTALLIREFGEDSFKAVTSQPMSDTVANDPPQTAAVAAA